MRYGSYNMDACNSVSGLQQRFNGRTRIAIKRMGARFDEIKLYTLISSSYLLYNYKCNKICLSLYCQF